MLIACLLTNSIKICLKTPHARNFGARNREGCREYYLSLFFFFFFQNALVILQFTCKLMHLGTASFVF